MDEQTYRVLLKRGVFVDKARGGREVPYKIYYPAQHDLKKMPVVLWSHGLGGSRDGASFISRFLAARGYTLVHLTHRGTDSSLWEGKGGHPWDIISKTHISRAVTLARMKDIPFVLDCLECWVLDEPEIGQHMDLKRIGMSGHSFGALTTQVMAGMKFPDERRRLMDLRDSRISCAIAYSPVPISHLSDAPFEDIYGSIAVPMLHMTGTEDYSPLTRTIDYTHRLVVRDYAGHPEQYLHVLEGGDHMIYNGTRGKLARNPARQAHESLILQAVFAFWQAYLKNDEQARTWLEQNCS
ncbi:MAG: alpha/beta hydrolase family protein [Alphaproteobacteria bacterium]